MNEPQSHRCALRYGKGWNKGRALIGQRDGNGRRRFCVSEVGSRFFSFLCLGDNMTTKYHTSKTGPKTLFLGQIIGHIVWCIMNTLISPLCH